MVDRSIKSLLVAAFSLIYLSIPGIIRAQNKGAGPGQDLPGKTVQVADKKEEKSFDPAKVILEHVADAHEFHFAVVGERHLTIPLPVLLYSKGKGWSLFMSSAFHHGDWVHDGYILLEEKFMDKHLLTDSLDSKGEPSFKAGVIYRTDSHGMPDLGIKVYDFSLTRNVVQTLISVLLLIYIMIGIARRYSKGHGVRSAPTGFQNAVEPMITFIRDEVGKPNLGTSYERYMPFLLTVFFFILINSLISMIPGTANVTGNIAFTGVLGLIAFVVIMINTNKYYWSHIFNPPVPMGVKFIMIPVEILGIFTKPFALIIRLFANMISGHIIILSFICLIFIFGAMNIALGWGTSPFFVLLAVFIYLIEILVAFIQAYIFANLTAVFVGMAMQGAHHQKGSGHEDAVLI
jgi:F-type H+-transporting ATPase subunit a